MEGGRVTSPLKILLLQIIGGGGKGGGSGKDCNLSFWVVAGLRKL